MQQSEITIFCSYSPGEQAQYEMLDRHLSLSIRDRPLHMLHREKVPPGSRIQEEIDRAIDAADLILLLVSAEFLADEECQRQVQRAMERQSKGTPVVPIIVRPCLWKEAPFADLRHLPRDTDVILSEHNGTNLDRVFTEIAKELREVILKIPLRIPVSVPQDSYARVQSDGFPSEPRSAGETTIKYDSGEIPTVRRGHTHPRAGYAFGVDIGRSHLVCYLARMDSEKIIARQVKAPLDTARMGGEKTLPLVVEMLLGLTSENHISWEMVRGIGISVPGVPDRRNKLISPPLMGKWFDLDIAAFLKSRLPRAHKSIPIYLNNDANMGAFGESRSIKGRVIKNLIYVKVGIGIGTGLIFEGQLYRGHNGAAGEFGHVLLEQESGELLPPCASCGKHGCLESLAGEQAIIEEVRVRGEFPPGGRLTIDDIVEAADQGNAACRRALENAGNRIGRAIGSCLVNIINPSLIALDGSVIRADEKGSQLLFTALCQSAARSSLPVAWQGTKIDIARLGNEAVAHGTIMTVIEEYKKLARY